MTPDSSLKHIFAFIQSLLLILSCFASSVFLLGIIQLPLGEFVSCGMLILVAAYFAQGDLSRSKRSLLLVSPVLLSLATPYLLEIFTPLLLAAWYWLLYKLSPRNNKFLPKHFCAVVLFYQVVDVFLLKHSIVLLEINDLFHEYSQLVRQSRGDGPIWGPVQLHYRMLLFSVITTIPFYRQYLYQILFPALQSSFVIVSIPFLLMGNIGPYAISIIAITASVCVACCTYRTPEHNRSAYPGGGVWTFSTRGNGSRRDSLKVIDKTSGDNLTAKREWRNPKLIVTLVVLYTSLVLITNAADGLDTPAIASFLNVADHNTSSTKNSKKPSILFVNDNKGIEGDESDITNFATKDNLSGGLSAYEQSRRDARYSTLSTKLLPFLGYDVFVKHPSDIAPEELENYNLVVMICLQNELLETQKVALLEAIENGATNLIIAGDHTDIRGVQGPFNDIMLPLGVTLNYDSLYPFGQWDSQIIYNAHSINGFRALRSMGSQSSPGISVGGSLTLDPLVARPLLEAGDGFSDLGTPNAPMYAGLGDQRYNPNELRGGLVLAAERPLGRGTILAFGDTAFLQNVSLSKNFAYVATLFSYATRSPSLLNRPSFFIISLLFSIVLLLHLTVDFSPFLAVVCLISYVSMVFASSTLLSHSEVISGLSSGITIIDESHAESFRHHDKDKGIHSLIDLLDKQTQGIVLVSDALESLSNGTVASVWFLGPQGSLSDVEVQSLLEFVDQGGHAVFTAGYYESLENQTLLESIGCNIRPVVLGAGQELIVVEDEYKGVLQLNEAWQMNLSEQWQEILTCYGRPVMAKREYGSGEFLVVSDAHAFLDMLLEDPNGKLDVESIQFLLSMLDSFSQKESIVTE